MPLDKDFVSNNMHQYLSIFKGLATCDVRFRQLELKHHCIPPRNKPSYTLGAGCTCSSGCGEIQLTFISSCA